MFWLKKKITTFRQYFPTITTQDSFKNKFNFIFDKFNSRIPHGVISTLILDICYSFLKNRYWYKSVLFKQIVISKISSEFGLSSSVSEEIFDSFENFFDNSPVMYDASFDTCDSYSSDLSFMRYICTSILATSDLDMDKDENFNVYELGLGKDILDKVKSVSINYANILDQNQKHFLSDLDKDILLSLEQIATLVDKNQYYIDIAMLSYSMMEFFCKNQILSSKIFPISKAVFDMFLEFSKKPYYSLSKKDSIYAKFTEYQQNLSEPLTNTLIEFLQDSNLIYCKISGISTKYSLSTQSQNIISSAYSDRFLESEFSAKDVVALGIPYQVKVLSKLKGSYQGILSEIFTDYLEDLSPLSLLVCCKYVNYQKDKLGINSDDILDKVSFLKAKSLNGINVAIYDRISTMILNR